MLKKIIQFVILGASAEVGRRFVANGGLEKAKERATEQVRAVKAKLARRKFDVRSTSIAFDKVLEHANFYSKEKAYVMYCILAAEAPILARKPLWAALWISEVLSRKMPVVTETDIKMLRAAQFDAGLAVALVKDLANAISLQNERTTFEAEGFQYSVEKQTGIPHDCDPLERLRLELDKKRTMPRTVYSD